MLRFLVLIILLIPSVCFGADIHWVDDTGTQTTWTSCEFDTDPGGPASNYCTLATALSNVAAGDTVYLKGGTYDRGIIKSDVDGTSVNKITFVAATGETPTISNTTNFLYSGRYHALLLEKCDYWVIDGITFSHNTGNYFVGIQKDSNWNEIKNCTFDGNRAQEGFRIDKGDVSLGDPSAATHNWIHDCELYELGPAQNNCGDSGGIYFGAVGTPYDNASGNNTIEDCTLYKGGHHLIETQSENNVIRNNVFHNEGWDTNADCGYYEASTRNSLYGNRLIQLYHGDHDGVRRNLVEGNRLGHAAMASDGKMDGNLTISSEGNIIRYNDSFYSETWGMYFKTSDGDNNRVYNNTLYHNGQDSQIYNDPDPTDWRHGIGDRCNTACTGNIIINNIIYDSFTSDVSDVTNTYTNNWVTTDGNPNFTNTDVSDPTSTTLPNLELQPNSGCIDNGIHLTTVSSVTDADTVVLDDSTYFQDGTLGSSLSNIQADWICFTSGTSYDGGSCVQIDSINYGTDTVDTTSVHGAGVGWYVWLYKKSDGEIVLYGSAPDQGAHEAIQTYWIHPSDNGASWDTDGCRSDTDPGAGKYCSLATANANVAAGETINMMGGTYDLADAEIQPINSGTPDDRITYQEHTGENVVFDGSSGHYRCVDLTDGQDYITVDGITCNNSYMHLWISGGTYNEIKNSTFSDMEDYTGLQPKGSYIATNSDFNWVHDCTFEKYGSAHTGDDIGFLFDVDWEGSAVGGCNDNVFEDNTFRHGSHHVLGICGKNNVFRNNYIQNDGWILHNGNYYSGRSLYMLGYINDDEQNLLENNKIAFSERTSEMTPTPSKGGTGGMIGQRYLIFRYNTMYHHGICALYIDKHGANVDCTKSWYYNNTFWYNGHVCYSDGCNSMWEHAILIDEEGGCTGNFFINNLFYDNENYHGASWPILETYEAPAWGPPDDQTMSNNWIGNDDGDPKFVNIAGTADPDNQNVYDLRLNSDSGAIDGGTSLTQVNDVDGCEIATEDCTSLVVDNAYPFQDGFGNGAGGGAVVDADWIAIGTVSNTTQISSIDYGNNTITLVTEVPWSDNDEVWLFKDSDGTQVLYGSAPDQGAYETSNTPGAFR